ncbi:MAG: ABC-type transport auxiliary lipoprotein family protein, partial [Azonexus sp.]
VEVRTPLWMDSMGIEYRLLYAEPARLLTYTRARWAGSPSQLILRRLGERLGMMPAGQGKVLCVLRIDVDAFTQVFHDPVTSRGRLQGRALLFGPNRLLVAAYGFTIEKPAPSADSRGGVAALTAAVDQLASDLAVWEKSVLGSAKGAGCTD